MLEKHFSMPISQKACSCKKQIWVLRTSRPIGWVRHVNIGACTESYTFCGAVIRNYECSSRDYKSHWKNIPILQILVEVKENVLENLEFKLALLIVFSLLLVRKLIVVWIQSVDQDTFRITESLGWKSPLRSES